jgi:hypothetical protein
MEGALPDLDARQRAFAQAILHPQRPVPPGLTGPDGKPDGRRFAVYRNNVVAGLIDALKAAYPVTRRIVGDEFFAAMARAFVLQKPPHSPVMLHYGEGFADFAGAFEPASALAYLRDVARLERAWVQAYHAREAVPLDLVTLGGMMNDTLAAVTLTLHPSIGIVCSPHPVVTIWRMNTGGGVPTAIDMHANGEDALVSRAVADVEVRALPRGAAAFIQSLQAGVRMVDALDFALTDEPSFDLSRTLKIMMQAGVIVGWTRVGHENATRSA